MVLKQKHETTKDKATDYTYNVVLTVRQAMQEAKEAG
jgi:hypothetical protein